MAIGHSICSASLVASLGKDKDYSNRYLDFPQGVKCSDGLTSIEWSKLLGALISIGLGSLGFILKALLNLEGCYVSVTDPEWYGVCILQLYSI